MTAAIRVAVLVDLELHPHAGGHVKSWLRLAEAALDDPRVDLTLHFLGEERTVPIAPNVRHRLHRPLLGTRRFARLSASPDHTDLAPLHPELWRDLVFSDVIHTTSAYFAFARTAVRTADRLGTPLVSSTHTDVPKYARLFAGVMLEPLEGRCIAERIGRRMERALERHLARCDRVLVSSAEDLERAERALPPERISRLRRGVDRARFHPRWRDREWLRREHGIDPDELLVLFVGRVDQSKSPLVLARAVQALREARGAPIRALFAGRGGQRSEVEAILGEGACLGSLVQDDLPRLYASADLFALPSTTEILPNVVLEAKSSGLPVIVSGRGGSRELVEDGLDGLVVESGEPREWMRAIERSDRSARERMGRAARRSIETAWPTWREVLDEDLIPIWQSVSGASPGAATAADPADRTRLRGLGG